MTEAPLRADPEDRPLPPSGGTAPASPPGEPPSQPAPAQVPGQAPGRTPEQIAARPATPHTRPIGSPARRRRDWRRTWPGFLIGVAALGVAIGAAWMFWDLAGPQIAPPPAEQLPGSDLVEIEALLDGLGFPPGRIDGVIDADAGAAIRDFQITAGLPADGAPSSALLEELRAAHAELSGGQ